MSSQFLVSETSGVASIDLNRPDEGNALTREMMFQLADHIRALGDKAQTRVVVIRSRGAQFCRGRDGRGESLQGMSPYDVRVKLMGAVLGVYDAIYAAPVPVVALVHAPAIGFGAALAGGCDITLASDAARFRFSEIEHGIPPVLAMSAVIGKVPAKALSYLIYSAEEIDAEQAVACGLASRVFAQAVFEERAARFLAGLASRTRLVLETIKKFQQNAKGLSSRMASEYAGTLLALVR